MMPKLINILVAVIGVNIVGVIVFYGWVLSNQLRRSKLTVHYPEVNRGGAGNEQIFHPRAAGAETREKIAPFENRQEIAPPHAGERMDSEKTGDKTGHQSVGIFDKPLISLEKKLILGGHTLKPVKQKPLGLGKIPPVPMMSSGDFVPPLEESIMQMFQRYPEKPATEKIVILTPIHDVESKIKTVFLKLLQSLTYPHHLITIAFGEDSSHDNTLHAAEAIAQELRKSFAGVNVYHFNLGGQIEGSWSDVHSQQNQLHRRSHLAKARNLLLKAGLADQTWTLWIDSDVTYFPPDIIQQLLSAEKDIVAPLCVFMDEGQKRVFDKNTWRETAFSLSHLADLPEDTLVVEGYQDTRRLFLSDLRAEGRVVPIDGVGGCTLLVRSQCHKDGVIFPETLYHHHIETEGLSKLAKDKGYGVYGMPFVEVVH